MSAFLGFVAQPSLQLPRGGGGAAAAFVASCAPQSPAEKTLAATPSPVPNAAGWFFVCSQVSFSDVDARMENDLPCNRALCLCLFVSSLSVWTFTSPVKRGLVFSLTIGFF